MGFEEFRLMIADFLNIVIINNNFVSLDVWSIVHFFAGFFIFLILSLFLKPKTSFLVLFVILILNEIVEFVLYGIIKTRYFIPETLVNVIWDLIIGMFGGILAWFLSLPKTLNCFE